MLAKCQPWKQASGIPFSEIMLYYVFLIKNSTRYCFWRSINFFFNLKYLQDKSVRLLLFLFISMIRTDLILYFYFFLRRAKFQSKILDKLNRCRTCSIFLYLRRHTPKVLLCSYSSWKFLHFIFIKEKNLDAFLLEIHIFLFTSFYKKKGQKIEFINF